MRSVEHYTEAEEQLAESEQHRRLAVRQGDDVEMALAMHEAALAQVHASLALAGATAMQAYSTANDAELDDWAKAAGGAE